MGFLATGGFSLYRTQKKNENVQLNNNENTEE